MSKKEEGVVAPKVEVNNTPIVSVKNSELSDDLIIAAGEKGTVGDMLKGMNKGYTLTSEYYEPTEGQVDRMFVVEMTKVQAKSSQNGVTEVDAIRMVNGDNKTMVSAATVLVGSIRGKNLPCAVEITYKGKKKGASGFSYDDFDVFVLG
tara:strand:+ start:434 stop:880 length:447 start_codon:yes stop_codon:yes gene_type:complete